MGQAIAIQAGVFPPVFQQKFAQLFDSAPQDTWAQVAELMRQEFGRSPEEVFDYIDHRAVASASIAQVHRARLHSGEWVAVKLQHNQLSKQIAWDLAAYRAMMWIYDRLLFKMPIYFIAEHVSRQLEREVVFTREVANSEELRAHIDSDPDLRGKVHVPRVYKELSTDRVIVSEWIDGVGLNAVDTVRHSRYDASGAVKLLLNVFAKQIFSWGIVHCDPHPGNIMLRRVNGRQQLVLIDHGLYIRETEQFRKQYVRLWKGMFQLDTDAIKQTAKEWGFGDSELFESSIRLRAPPANGSASSDNSGADDMDMGDVDFSKQEEMRERMKHFLQDTTKIPWS
jgi:aarF domain-containing kinase